jgi:hypothetical protein
MRSRGLGRFLRNFFGPTMLGNRAGVFDIETAATTSTGGGGLIVRGPRIVPGVELRSAAACVHVHVQASHVYVGCVHVALGSLTQRAFLSQR